MAKADDLLSQLAGLPREAWPAILEKQSIAVLRAAVDLCLEDAEGMSKKKAITTICEKF